MKRMTVVPQKKAAQRIGFKTGEFIVYPAHGVGQIVNIEEQEVAGHKLELFVIDFQKDKMRLKVPVAKATAIGMRKLSETDYVERALKVVQGRARIKRTMWSRRAQEYDAKINSGDLISISEVVRDLFRADNQPEQSYSERQLYEAALDRMAREISAVNKMSETEAVRLIEVNLAKGPKRGAKTDETETEVEADVVAEDEQEEAA
ncbi:CarD family transcriptional regulator [Phyllobacterium sp. SB3]|uniref:CarD family transcriptional regulator n=1 Tax=Phyllobacterium sp. SB3 TaxID=3156073 RepID=UPI0032B01182